MSSEAALAAHQSGDLDKAKHFYKQSVLNYEQNPAVYQNYGALLRSDSKLKESLEVYTIGLDMFPTHVGILINASNLYWEMGNKVNAIELNMRVLSILLSIDKGPSSKDWKHFDVLSAQLIEQLIESSCYSIAFNLLPTIFHYALCGPKLLLAVRLLCLKSKSIPAFDSHQTLYLVDLIDSVLEDEIENASPEDSLNIKFVLAFTAIEHEGIVKAEQQYLKIESEIAQQAASCASSDRDKLLDSWNTHSWNLSVRLLQGGRFELGWKLFDYGLVTKASGKQMWQRALIKPFSNSLIPLWKGEPLSGKKLLVLEEQAIGDVMMFLTLLPTLIHEADHVSLMLNTRLVEIYKRSFQAFLDSGHLTIFNCTHTNDYPNPADYDYQVPLGSILQHRFTNINLYGNNCPNIVSDSSGTDSLKSRYSQLNPDKTLRIGLSWRGGGQQKRMLEKSIPIHLLCTSLKNLSHFDSIQFVSLQYGTTDKEIEQFNSHGVPILFDTSINAIKNLDKWLCQVDACDAVISVANTTIHGAGGLNKPTLCLLSDKSDWRWLQKDISDRSYWYPSVQCAFQDENLNWSPALNRMNDWLASYVSHV